MLKKTLIAAGVALTGLVAVPAFAHDGGRDNGWHNGWHNW